MDEQQFRKIIIQIRALAKSQCETISKEQVHNRFLPLNVTEGQFLLIYKYLGEEKVKLYDTEKERLNALSKGSSTPGIGTNKSTPNVKDEPADYRSGEQRIKINHADSEYLKMYIEELNEMVIPMADERMALIESVLKDRDSAVRILPPLYLENVVDIARLYTGQGVAIEDLIGEGNIGVMTAANMLDLCESVKEVDEFMMKMIMDSMESLILDSLSGDEFDLQVAERVNDLNDRAKELAEELERLVTVDELVKELDMEEEYIRETIRLAGNAIEYIKDK